MRIRTGCDLVEVASISDSIDRYGDRYLNRVFTATELEETVGRDRNRRLAARFAAKEAVVKALRLGNIMGPWTEIEITRHPQGGPQVRFHGQLKDAPETHLVTSIDVSMAHEGHLAIATAAAVVVPDAALSLSSTSTRPDRNEAI